MRQLRLSMQSQRGRLNRHLAPIPGRVVKNSPCLNATSDDAGSSDENDVVKTSIWLAGLLGGSPGWASDVPRSSQRWRVNRIEKERAGRAGACASAGKRPGGLYTRDTNSLNTCVHYVTLDAAQVAWMQEVTAISKKIPRFSAFL